MSEHPTSAPARKRPRGFETTGDMVRSVLVVMALVLAIFFIGVRPEVQERPPADVTGVVEQASGSGLSVTEPQLPQGWSASTARFGPDAQEGLPTFHVGYLDPTGQYGGISATAGATPTWVRGVVGQDAEQDGERELAGRTWQVWVNEETGGTTLVGSSGTSGLGGTGQALAVTSRGDDADLVALTEAAVAATR